jgi:mxaC protein
MITLDHPLVLLLLPLALVPLLVPLLPARAQPALGAADAGRAGRGLGPTLRVLGAVAIAALVAGLAGPWWGRASQVRVGTGAHLALVIDRSLSMNDSFAGRTPDGQNESKAAAAKRLLTDFVHRRPHDRMAVVGFSTAPMLLLPMTDHKPAVEAAIAAIDEPGLSKTDVGRALAMAFSLFDDSSEDAARAIVLVSDGAGIVPREVQEALLPMAARQGASLYWLYLRTRGAKGIFQPPAPGEPDTAQARPERHLNLFLKRLRVPYRAFEAEDPEGVAQAIAEIDKLEAKPLLYHEEGPRRPLGSPLFGLATAAIIALLAARLLDRPLPPLPRGALILEDDA